MPNQDHTNASHEIAAGNTPATQNNITTPHDRNAAAHDTATRANNIAQISENARTAALNVGALMHIEGVSSTVTPVSGDVAPQPPRSQAEVQAMAAAQAAAAGAGKH